VSDAPFHAHIYYEPDERAAAAALREQLAADSRHVLFAGRLSDRPVGPHPIPQFEIHFLEPSLPALLPVIEASGLRALIHPLTDDDVADHETLGRWLGTPLALDLSVLDPPGANQGVARFGKAGLDRATRVGPELKGQCPAGPKWPLTVLEWPAAPDGWNGSKVTRA
jgi:aromatic ring-cleaving dioxygenase